MNTKPEPHNPLYLLLLVASLLFVLTALGYAVVPTLEEKAAQRGAEVPHDDFRAALRKDGWKWLLYELAAMIVLGLASMGLDRIRLRRLQNQQNADTMPAQATDESLPTSRVSDEQSGAANP